ncbi:MAG: hypothetical protein J6332_00560, partial [Abditibacteriota bacterium]|nr:hypothetical protein [Abditibacteriota bacterium]
MKKTIILLVALCAMAASAFAGVTIGNWGVNDGDFANPRIYEGLITDIAPAGFTVHATSGVFGG